MKRTAAAVPRSLPLLPALLAALVALQCIEPPLSPVAPFWQTQLSIPLADITRTLADAFKDTSTVKRDLAGGFYFEDTQAGQPVRLDTLKVSPQPAAEQVSVGRVEISALPTTTAGVAATDLGLPAGTWPGAPFPAFSGATTTLPAIAVGDTTLFEFAAVDTGSLTLSITNTLPMAITFNGAVVLQNNLPGIDTTVIASFPFATIPSGASVSHPASLAGKLVWGRLRTAPVSVTIASKAGPFDINSSTGVQLSFGSSPLRVDSARAVVPPQQVVSINDSVIVVDDSVSVTDARFRRGTFSTRIVNNLDVQVGVRLKFGNFRSTITGDTMSILRIVLPRSVAVFPFSLDTIQLVNPTPDPIGTRVRFSVGIETITSAGQKSTITANDFVRAEFTPQNSFVLQSITGRIKPLTVAFASGASGVDMGEAADKFSGNFTFDSVRIAVRLGLTGGYPVRYSLALEARNRKTNTVATLRLPPPAGQTDTVFYPAGGAMTTIALGNSQGLNTFLSNFFPNFPDTFIVRGSVVINPAFDPATISDTSKLYQAVNMYFPLKIGLANGKIEDKISLGGESKFPTEFARDIKQASLRFSVTNKIPAQLAFRLRLLGRLTPGSPRDTLLRIPVDGSSRTIAAATVDANGNAVAPSASSFEIGLTTQQVDLFNKADTMYVRLDLQTSGAGTQAVRFRTSDFIRLRMSGNLVYIVNQPN
ncbi:MAG: hypothetical protein AABY75_08920 [Bacteroidota bacterium]